MSVYSVKLIGKAAILRDAGSLTVIGREAVGGKDGVQNSGIEVWKS